MIYAERPGGNLVSSAEVSDPWAKDYSCPDCEHETHFVKAHLRDIGDEEVFVMAHFRHNPIPGGAGPAHDTTDCSVAEHSEHERMRIIAFQMLKKRCVNGSSKIPDDFPRHVAAGMDDGPQGGSKTKAIGGRHPDAYVEFGDTSTEYGNGIVLEIQYMHTDKNIKEVTRNYIDAGYSILWTRPKDYTDTGHGVELGEIITPALDYPFIDEYRAESWPELFNTGIVNDAPPLPDDMPKWLVEPLVGAATFFDRWFENSDLTEPEPEEQPIVELEETALPDVDSDIPPPFEVQPLPPGHNKECAGCGSHPTTLILPRVDRATPEDHLPLCDGCAPGFRWMVRADPEPEDFYDMADRAKKVQRRNARRLLPVTEMKITDSDEDKQYRLREDSLDNPVERLRVEYHIDMKGATVHLPERLFTTIDPVDLTMTVKSLSDSQWHIVEVKDGCLNGLESKAIVGRKHPDDRR